MLLKMKKYYLFFLLFLSYNHTYLAQKRYIIDEQRLTYEKTIALTQSENRYELMFINQVKNDTTYQSIEGIQHAHCSPPNSIFFVNDSIGFLTESGGCYASYNWLFRTKDRGVTWEFIESASGTEVSYGSKLNNETFYMFNERAGIIIWRVEKNNLIYSITNDGGLVWAEKKMKVSNLSGKVELSAIEFSAEGQVLVSVSDKYILESQRKKTTILESTNFGKTFREIN
jgi:hypothetical protein